MFIELSQVDLLLKSTLISPIQIIQNRVDTYSSSISAGVRLVTSGRINQATTTDIAPVAAKLGLERKSQISNLMTDPSTVWQFKLNIQEPRFNTPLGCTLVDHQRSTEAEHKSHQV